MIIEFSGLGFIEPFRICWLNGTANPAHSHPNWDGLAVLFSRQLPNSSPDLFDISSIIFTIYFWWYSRQCEVTWIAQQPIHLLLLMPDQARGALTTECSSQHLKLDFLTSDYLLLCVFQVFKCLVDHARTYLQLPLQQWGAGNVYLSVLSSWKVNIVKKPIAVMGL